MSSNLIHVTESQVAELLNWPLVYEAVKEALSAITATKANETQPVAHQPSRSFTRTRKGVLLSMPGFIHNYSLTEATNDTNKKFSTLACKLVTSFSGNALLGPPKPNILGNIFILNHETGELQAIVAGTEITAWRTAAASIVSTDYLFLRNQPANGSPKALAIIGCGVQGRIHAIGFAHLISLSKIFLWNRTESRAIQVYHEINAIKRHFKNPNLEVICVQSVEECVREADIIVTATFTSTPLLHLSMLKQRVHINAVGAGQHHHDELALNIYQNSNTKIYVDNWASARTELSTLDAPIVGEVGDIINGTATAPNDGITIFHSMGMAIEDATVAQACLQLHQNNLSAPKN